MLPTISPRGSLTTALDLKSQPPQSSSLNSSRRAVAGAPAVSRLIPLLALSDRFDSLNPQDSIPALVQTGRINHINMSTFSTTQREAENRRWFLRNQQQQPQHHSHSQPSAFAPFAAEAPPSLVKGASSLPPLPPSSSSGKPFSHSSRTYPQGGPKPVPPHAPPVPPPLGGSARRGVAPTKPHSSPRGGASFTMDPDHHNNGGLSNHSGLQPFHYTAAAGGGGGTVSSSDGGGSHSDATPTNSTSTTALRPATLLPSHSSRSTSLDDTGATQPPIPSSLESNLRSFNKRFSFVKANAGLDSSRSMVTLPLEDPSSPMAGVAGSPMSLTVSSSSSPRVIGGAGAGGGGSGLTSNADPTSPTSTLVPSSPLQQQQQQSPPTESLEEFGTRLTQLFRQSARTADLFVFLSTSGGKNWLPELAPTTLDQALYQDLGLLFATLDRDGDGAIVADDIAIAVSLFPKLFRFAVKQHSAPFKYEKQCFRRLDRRCRGAIEFPHFVASFFPQAPTEDILKRQQALKKPVTKVGTTMELLAPEDIEEIRRNYRVLCQMTGGPTLDNMLSLIQDATALEIAAACFRLHDVSGDGQLDFEEYVEMMRHNYPPFRTVDPTSSSDPSAAHSSSDAAASKSPAPKQPNSNNNNGKKPPHQQQLLNPVHAEQLRKRKIKALRQGGKWGPSARFGAEMIGGGGNSDRDGEFGEGIPTEELVLMMHEAVEATQTSVVQPAVPYWWHAGGRGGGGGGVATGGATRH